MVFQLPSAVEAEVIASIIYSVICLLSSFLLVWLLWTHNDRASYIACIAYATLVISFTSVCQQFYDYAFWRDILTDQFYYARENADNAEVQYYNGARGVKLVLSYIRLFGFTIASSFVFFFALSLAASVYGWFAATPRMTHTISIVGKILPLALTTITVGLLLTPPAQNSFLIYMVVANAQFVLSLMGSAILLLMILARYVNSRRNLTSWKVIYGDHGPSLPSTNDGGSKTRSIWAGTSSSRVKSRAYSGAGQAKAYDSWLVIRLSIAFAVLCVFEYTNIVPRFAAKNHTIDLATNLQPDLSVRRARTSIRGYVPGVSPSLAAFLVFGTTKTFQQKMYQTFVPKIFQRQNRQKRKVSVADEAPAPLSSQKSTQRADPFDEEVSLDAMSPKFPQSANFSRKLPSRGDSEPWSPRSIPPKTPSESEPPYFQPIHPPPTADRVTPDLTLPTARAISPIVIPNLHSKFSTRIKRESGIRVSTHLA
ncbi:hypothetical protein LZ32DRAFT_601727 [Colletotrichum eremochloae]|nr:hypothetical protein LZ32DRAFT_601727 [Colletotrichum eremochloae]